MITCLHITGPFTGTGTGRVVELETAISDYIKDKKKFPDEISVDIKEYRDLMKAILYPSALSSGHDEIKKGPLLTGYVYSGVVIKVVRNYDYI